MLPERPQKPIELATKVDELLYSFNWYTVYEDCQRRVTCTHVLRVLSWAR